MNAYLGRLVVVTKFLASSGDAMCSIMYRSHDGAKFIGFGLSLMGDSLSDIYEAAATILDLLKSKDVFYVTEAGHLNRSIGIGSIERSSGFLRRCFFPAAVALVAHALTGIAVGDTEVISNFGSDLRC